MNLKEGMCCAYNAFDSCMCMYVYVCVCMYVCMCMCVCVCGDVMVSQLDNKH